MQSNPIAGGLATLSRFGVPWPLSKERLDEGGRPLSSGREAKTLERRLGLIVVAALMLLIVATAATILVLCQGHLIYSLDDPYISLALSDQIAHGHYGINAGESASPSSSILYPFVLAAFAWAPWQDWVPLFVNSIAACATGILIVHELCRRGIATGDRIVSAALLVISVCLASNVIGMVFAGLEHSLHLLTSVFVVFGLAWTLETGRIPRGLVAACVLLPLWRFEGMALALLTLFALAVAGHRRAAFIGIALICAALGLYMAAMAKLGLPLLPSSVMVKSDILQQTAEGGGRLVTLWRGIRANLQENLSNAQAYPVLLLVALAVAHWLVRLLRTRGNSADPLTSRKETLLVLVVVGALLAHILFGAWGLLARYEAYVMATGMAGCIILWRETIRRMMRNIVAVTACILAVLYAGNRCVIAEIMTPTSSVTRYEQQYQMHRFIVDFYRGPVAVNDIGWVSYRNPYYVLDLWGLGSEAARLKRAAGEQHPQWLRDLVASRHIGLVMIFDEWFSGQIPPTWRHIADLHSAHDLLAPSKTVNFYVASDDAYVPALKALRAFGENIDNPGTTLTIFAPTAAELKSQ
jgi:hypothetical protein